MLRITLTFINLLGLIFRFSNGQLESLTLPKEKVVKIRAVHVAPAGLCDPTHISGDHVASAAYYGSMLDCPAGCTYTTSEIEIADVKKDDAPLKIPAMQLKVEENFTDEDKIAEDVITFRVLAQKIVDACGVFCKAQKEGADHHFCVTAADQCTETTIPEHTGHVADAEGVTLDQCTKDAEGTITGPSCPGIMIFLADKALSATVTKSDDCGHTLGFHIFADEQTSNACSEVKISNAGDACGGEAESNDTKCWADTVGTMSGSAVTPPFKCGAGGEVTMKLGNCATGEECLHDVKSHVRYFDALQMASLHPDVRISAKFLEQIIESKRLCKNDAANWQLLSSDTEECPEGLTLVTENAATELTSLAQDHFWKLVTISSLADTSRNLGIFSAFAAVIIMIAYLI